MKKRRKTKVELNQELYDKVMRILEQYDQIEKNISSILADYSVGQLSIQPVSRKDIIRAVYSRLPRNLKAEFLRWLLQEYQLANTGMLLGLLSGFEESSVIESILKSIEKL